jgi:hypothetical protein
MRGDAAQASIGTKKDEVGSKMVLRIIDSRDKAIYLEKGAT